MQEHMDRTQREILKLSEALLLCQRELAQVREAQEPLQEQCSQLGKESGEAQVRLAHVSEALANHLSRAFWEERQPAARISWRRFVGSRWPRLKKLFGGRRATADAVEDGQIRLIESSALFDAAWYLQQHVDVALAGIHPAAHYLRAGAQEGRDPGPDFSTNAYNTEHPDAARTGVNPLVHFLRSGSAQ
jgi:hypothetical protein